MRAAEFITESLNQPYPWEVRTDRPGRFLAKFQTEVGYGYFDAEEWELAWDINFSINDAYDVTGGGDQFRIFATIMDIAKHWIDKHRPQRIKFSSDKSGGQLSRSRLYSAMCNKFAKQFGYHWASEEDSTNSEYTGRVLDKFVLVKDTTGEPNETN
jgi:hypothetical protein